MTTLETPALETFTLAIVVFFVGVGLNRLITPLGRWNIPEAVTGGLVASLATLVAHDALGLRIVFDLDARDTLLLFFFTGIGLNARFDDLVAGGRPLVTLLGLTLAFLIIQNLIAAGGAAALGLPHGVAALIGSAALIGGHGTTIAWAPMIEQRFGLQHAMEIGVASATLGLVAASLVGGPVAKFLIARHGLAGPRNAAPVLGLSDDEAPRDDIDHVALMRTLLVLSVAILIGLALQQGLLDLGLKLPPFVCCLLTAIVLTNFVPRLGASLPWPARSRSLALVSDFSLNVFLAMSLMSMQLWSVAELGPTLIVVLALQTLASVLFAAFAVFPAMGRNYDAAVLTAGFVGVTLGATPTAIANMTSVTKAHGQAPMAFIILPLVSAFFIDLANAAAIGFLVR
ncbi:ESS family glutamate:Na+ symporter [Roseiarcus fermentans]|uniref:Sodium/glutamate symporter n=1 Tax=Roseiarcus fermentans TaxID=1473586 RepID=A0A366EV75_9HYPH|nr:sodium/glutamate symporter [Roseiarcus fermentans]RBP06287.1 ESS family glutamate:Na+ symporter [Roseiarcus fermentans]